MTEPAFEWQLDGNFCALVGNVLYVHPESGLWGEENGNFVRRATEYKRRGFKMVECPLDCLTRTYRLTYTEFMAALITGDHDGKQR